MPDNGGAISRAKPDAKDGRGLPKVCAKCGSTHFGFQVCGSDPANKTHRQHNQPAPLLIESKHRTDRPFGDRLETIEMRGTTVLQKGWKIRRRGGVTPDPAWTKESA